MSFAGSIVILGILASAACYRASFRQYRASWKGGDRVARLRALELGVFGLFAFAGTWLVASLVARLG